MSRRKQQKPRLVKALAQTDDCRSTADVAAEQDDMDGSDKIFHNTTSSILHSETVEDDDEDHHHDEDNRPRGHLGNITVTSLHDRSSLDVSQTSDPNSSVPTSASLVPTSASLVPTSASLVPSVDETARCERFTSNRLSANQEDIPQFGHKAKKCLLCSAWQQDGTNAKAPVEGQDYFLDCDGTLAIRNGVCPRSLALSLFSQVLVLRSKYTKLLGKNMLKFLLNLKQIVAKQRQACPGENPSDLIKAEKVLRSFSFLENKIPNLTNGSEDFELTDTLTLKEISKSEIMEKDIVSPNIPDASLHIPSHQLSLLNDLTSDKERNFSALSQLPTSVQEHVYNSNDVGNIKSDASDNESAESFSRVASPSSSLSSVNSGPSLSDRTKDMANTKRGCKILPVASTDGQNHYLCPVCSLELSSDHELTIHIRSHNQSGQQSTPNTCTICGKTLSSQSSLDRHMLVHSGERPFKCKICDMSFTTNGNMHRHARIHEKNGIITPKSAGRKPIQHKPLSKEDIPFHEDKNNSVPVSHRYQPVAESDCDKRDLSNNHHQDQNACLPPFYRLPFSFSAAHHPAFPYQRLMPYHNMTMPFIQTVMHHLSGESLAQYFNPLSAMVREPSPDLRIQQQLHCNVCQTVFSNQFALESHMESHVLVDEQLEAESGSACKTCKTVAKSEASLLLHSLKHHSPSIEHAHTDAQSEEKCAPSSPSSEAAPSSCPTNNMNRNAMGFENLGFANFTTKKFPLIAKAFCESYPSTRSARLPVFKCKDCDLEFPVEGAKHLHEASHVPEEYTMCPKCNCHFSEPSRLQEHMQKHVSDLKFEESSQQRCLEHEGCMLQYHFLAQFGLTPKEIIDQALAKTGFEHADICMEEKSLSPSCDDSNRMAQSDNDDSSDMNQADTNEQKTDCGQMLIPMNRLVAPVSDSNTCSNSSSLATFFKASQNMAENADGGVPSSPQSSSLNSSADSDPSSTLRAPNVSVLRCKHCNITLANPRALKYHLYTHKNTSQFQCKVCNYSSADKNTLLRHMRVHSGERPYKCVICEYSFTTKANCERHLRQKHGLEKNQLSDKLVCNKHTLTSKNRQLSSDRQHNPVSKSSGADLSSGRYLQPHNSTGLEAGMDFACKKCMKTFPSRNSILRHISIHHPHIGEYQMGQLIASKKDVALPDIRWPLPSPPHAHLKSPVLSTVAMKCSALETMLIKQEPSLQGSLDHFLGDHFPTHLDVLLNTRNRIMETDSEQPLDFSQNKKHAIAPAQREHNELVAKAASFSQETVPIDLSVHKETISALAEVRDQASRKQRYPDLLTAAQNSDLKPRVFQFSHNCDSPFIADVDAEDRTHKITVVSAHSPDESDSSCEFAPVNKILGVTDAQNFHSYLQIPDAEDEQDMYISGSASSDEDSSISSGHTPSHLKTLPPKYQPNASPAGVSVWKRRSDDCDIRFTDSNMTEQAIAELIEKVSQENSTSPAKKKKNSYADSPHKFSCPFCPRCFPWLSSLNRHLLTHTGQKPFKCPRCPVIFSTKSNRERHLIRKHNVNMLDPASRSTMDRPYKCHICMFSSFSTHNNLAKHYKDKHSGAVAPGRASLDKHLNDGVWDDIALNAGVGTSYEDEEEYNSMVEMQGGVSDMEVMYENYAQDSDSNHSSSNSAVSHDAQTKNNAVLNVNCTEIDKSNNKQTSDSPDISGPFVNKADKPVCAVTDDSQMTAIRENNFSKSALPPVQDNSKLIVEQHKQHLTNNVDGSSVQHGDQTLPSDPLLVTQPKSQHKDIPFQCNFCDCSFVARLECLQHLESSHQEAWALIKEKNDIGNIQVFSTRLDKMVDKLCKKETQVCEVSSDNKQHNSILQQNSSSTHLSKSSLNNNYKLNKSAKGTEALPGEHDPSCHDSTTDVQGNGCANSDCEAAASDCVLDQVCCALCPQKCKSAQDLRTHMNSHIDVRKLSAYPVKAAASLKSRLICLPTASSSHKVYRSNDKNCEGVKGCHRDMLHDLLGVESSTIDQIFESSDSAASLLGVNV